MTGRLATTLRSMAALALFGVAGYVMLDARMDLSYELHELNPFQLAFGAALVVWGGYLVYTSRRPQPAIEVESESDHAGEPQTTPPVAAE